ASAAPTRGEYGRGAGESGDPGARAPEHGGEAATAHRAAALFRGIIVRAAVCGRAGVLDSEARVYAPALDGPGGQQVFDLRHLLGDRGNPGDPQDRQRSR